MVRSHDLNKDLGESTIIKHKKNRDYVQGCPELFNFGKSLVCELLLCVCVYVCV